MAGTGAGDGGFGALQHVTINGVSLAYREVGTGEPLVLVHGGLGDLRSWAAQLEPLGARCRVIAYSRRYARPNEPIAPTTIPGEPLDPKIPPDQQPTRDEDRDDRREPDEDRAPRRARNPAG